MNDIDWIVDSLFNEGTTPPNTSTRRYVVDRILMSYMYLSLPAWNAKENYQNALWREKYELFIYKGKHISPILVDIAMERVRLNDLDKLL